MMSSAFNMMHRHVQNHEIGEVTADIVWAGESGRARVWFVRFVSVRADLCKADATHCGVPDPRLRNDPVHTGMIRIDVERLSLQIVSISVRVLCKCASYWRTRDTIRCCMLDQCHGDV